jgi:hypothetical protein
MWKPAAGLVALTFVAIPHTHAATCDEEIKLFAEQYDLLSEVPRSEPPSGAHETPATMESRGVRPETLSRSDDAMESPKQGPPLRTDAPLSGVDVMPAPHTSDRRPQGTEEMSGTKRLHMQSLLNAARAAQREGKETECFERLGEARSIPEPG